VDLCISALPDGLGRPALRMPSMRMPCGADATAAEVERYNQEASAIAQSIAASCAGCGMQLSTCAPPRSVVHGRRRVSPCLGQRVRSPGRALTMYRVSGNQLEHSSTH
jgi:hypothetical protein